MIIVCDGYRGASSEGVPYKESKFRSGIVDPSSAANYEAYKAKLRERADERGVPALRVLELESRHGFGFAVRAALELVRTPYVLVVQHDWPFVRRADVPRVLAAMEADRGRLKYVGLPTSTTVGHRLQQYVLSKYGMRIAPFDVDKRGLQMLPLIQWYDSTHICEVDHYRGFVFGPRKLVARGGFIEDKFGMAQLAEIRERGLEAAHPAYGTFIVLGDGFAEPCVAHQDGRDARNVSKFRFSKAEDLDKDVQLQAEEVLQWVHGWPPRASEVASHLVRSSRCGEAASVETAAARAAEAARLRVAEALRQQAARDLQNGKVVDSSRERPAEKGSVMPLPKEAWKEYYVDNAQLKAHTPGLGFRMSRRLGDRAGDDSSVEWGSTIMGVDLGDGWLRVSGGRYLPTHLNLQRVLCAADGIHRDTPSPGHGRWQRLPSPSEASRPPPPRAPAPQPHLLPGPVSPAWGPHVNFSMPVVDDRLPAAQHGAYSPSIRAEPVGTAAANARNGSQQKTKQPGAGPSEACSRPSSPSQTWQYIDPKGNIQGPFRLVEMQHWFSKGYFPKDLPIRCDANDRFVQFHVMFPLPSVPFKSSPRRPSPPSAG